MTNHDDDTVTALRERLRAADSEIVTPPGLWDRVRTPLPETSPAGTPVSRRRHGRRATIALAAAAVAVVVSGTWWWLGHFPPVPPVSSDTSPDGLPGQAARGTVDLTVHNAEKPCRSLHILECALRLARDPYAPYAANDNAAGRVWHGDRLTASCVVTDGTMITDESGISSTRWYRVRTADGVAGWLPGVRTRNSTEVRLCTAEEVPSG